MPSGVSACDLREEVFLVLYLKDISAGEEKCKIRFKKHFCMPLFAYGHPLIVTPELTNNMQYDIIF